MPGKFFTVSFSIESDCYFLACFGNCCDLVSLALKYSLSLLRVLQRWADHVLNAEHNVWRCPIILSYLLNTV